MEAEELDRLFDSGADIMDHIDLTTARRPNLQTKGVNVDFPQWMVDSLDREAKRLGGPDSP